MRTAATPKKEVVELGGQLLDFDYVLANMDPGLCYEAMEFAGYGATPQAVVDEYVRLLERRADRAA